MEEWKEGMRDGEWKEGEEVAHTELGVVKIYWNECTPVGWYILFSDTIISLL